MGKSNNHRSTLVRLTILLLFVFIPIIIFRSYIFKGNVPFPSNLLVSYFQPWVSYPVPEYPNGPPNKPMGFDNLRIHYPLKTQMLRLIHNTQMPLWNPHNFTGNTLLATYQIAVFHPMHFLFLILPQIDAWSIIIMLQPFFFLLFMYLFLRAISLSQLASLFGAIAFGLSGFSIVWWEEAYVAGYTAIGLPFMLLGIEKIRKRITPGAFIIMVSSVVWSICSGWFQFTVYSFFFVFIWIIWSWKVKRISGQQVRYISLACILAFLISSVHLIPSMEAFLLSARGSSDASYLFTGYLLPIQNIITAFIPDFFGNPASYNYFGNGFYYERILYFGVLPLMLAIYSIISIKKDSMVQLLKVLFFITLSLGFALPTSWFLLYTLKLPLVSVMIPSRIFFLTIFIGSMLSARAFEGLEKTIDKKSMIKTLLLCFIFFASAWIVVLYFKTHDPLGSIALISFRNLILPTAQFVVSIFLIILLKRFSKIVLIAMIGVCLFSGLYFANKYLYFSDRRLIFQETPVTKKLKELIVFDRYISYGKGAVENNIATELGLFSPEGYDSFLIRRYAELVDYAVLGGIIRDDIPRADVVFPYSGDYTNVLRNSYTKRLMDLTSVRYIVGFSKTDEGKAIDCQNTDLLTLVWKDDTYCIHTYTQAVPRAYAVKTYEVVTSKVDQLSFIFNSSNDIRTTVLLEEDPGLTKIAGDTVSTVVIDSYDSLSVTLSASLTNPSLVVLTDAFYPGWHVYVDGHKQKIYRANYAFRAVSVPNGTHKIEFRYEPDSWRIGILVSCIGVILLIISFLNFRFRKNI